MAQSQYPGTAIILAGGQSSRLGFDKQQLKFGEEYLIDMLLKLLAPVFQELIVVSNTPEFHAGRSCRVVSDSLIGQGPLGGLHAGLAAASFEVCYLTACDMPWISVPYIRYLLEFQRTHPEAEAVVTRLGTMLEPMNALYVRGLAPRIEALLKSDRRKMAALLACSQTLYVPEEVALRYSADWVMFDNINTPEDWERFQKQAEGGGLGDQTNPNQAAGT